MSTLTTSLVELRRHYEKILAQSKYRAAQARVQLAHVDALLLNGLVQATVPPLAAGNGMHFTATRTIQSLKPVTAGEDQDPRSFHRSPSSVDAIPSELKGQRAQDQADTVRPRYKRATLTLQPDYEGMTKLEAIAKVLAGQPGEVVHQDRIIHLLYGNLSLEDHRQESRRMRASLFQGLRKGLWQRASESPSSYRLPTSESVQQSPSASNDNLSGEQSVSATSAQAKREARPVSPQAKAKSKSKFIQLKPGRPPRTAARSKAAKLTAASEKSEPKRLEVVALLRKPSFSL